MRWNPRENDEQKLRALKALGWTRWFAWYPVRATDGTGDWVWLETVERRVSERSAVWRDTGYDGLYLTWDYRPLRGQGIWTRVNCDPRE